LQCNPMLVPTALVPFVAAFAVSMLFGPGVIAMLKRRNVGQTISSDGPESHQTKAGTPTMGGLIILAGVFVGAALAAWVLTDLVGVGAVGASPRLILAVVALMAAYAALGMADDYLTIHPVKGVRGIASKPKAVAQVLLAVAFVMWLSSLPSQVFSPELYVRGFLLLSGTLYYAFAVVFIVAMANFVNITDGVDGLVSGLTAIACVAFWLIMQLTGSAFAANTIGSVLWAIAGACVAFLWFNANPAKVFMGDTGSMALGVALPAIAILAHKEILVIIIGLVFIVDGLSSALQWAVFKYTRIRTGTGRRVFKKSPIHHHFELSGWPEQMVVVRFWIMGIIAAALAFAGAAWGWW